MSGASAAEQCDAVIVDGAQKFGDDLSDVEEAWKSLATLGADVRVRTLTSLGRFDTLDDYVASTQSECGSWQSAAGTRKNNLLVFAMSVNDRKVGIFYGEQWKQAFKNSGGEGRIYNNQMGPRFRDGDFAGGFVAGMNESFRVIDKFLHPDKANTNSGPAVVVEKEPTDLSGLWVVLGLAVGLGVLVILLYFGYQAYTRRREAEEERRTIRQRALSARDATTQITQQVGDTKRATVRRAKVTKYSQVGDARAQQLDEALHQVESNLETASNAVASAVSASGNAEDANLSSGEYAQMAERYEAALVAARQAQQADRRIDELAKEIETELAQVSQDTLTTQAEIDQTAAAARALKDEGITTDGIDVDAAQTALDRAKENPADLQALQHLGAARQALNEAQAKLETLTEQREQLAREIPALEERIAQVQDLTGTAHDAFNRISNTYPESSWESVRGNGTEAEKCIASAKQALIAAKKQSGIDRQQWVEATSSVQEGNLALDKAQSLLHSVTERERNLQVAQQQAPGALQAAQADIEKAAAYIANHDDDVSEQLESDLTKAQETLKQAQTELAEQLPDFLRVMRLATEADSMADRILQNAQNEYEAAERLRQQAASTLTLAVAATSKAEEYIEDHNSDVGSSAETSLRSAKEALRKAQATRSPANVLSSAQSALEHANTAYQRAKRDFDNAEEERRAEARRRREEQERANHTTVIVSNDYGGGWGSSSSRRSGGSDWGGSSGGWSGGDGGGSSGSFGGGGDGGGSSGGW